MSEYMDFRLIEKKPKTNVYSVDSKSGGYQLGIVKWYGPWRQYCFVKDDLIFSAGCLRDLATFIESQRERGKDFKDSLKNLINNYILSCKGDFDFPSYPPDINCKGWKLILNALEIQDSLLKETKK